METHPTDINHLVIHSNNHTCEGKAFKLVIMKFD